MVPNGLLPNVTVRVTRRLDAERWAVAEECTAELIARIQPTPASEERRRAVADYVQRLITGCLSCQVFTFGSFPLKTYLPDGDIDVTAFSNSEELKDTWAVTVRDALEHEEKSEKAEFRVREVQYIQAEVKIIKCLVENIVVDISFNQVGGLCTLCFLEEMDHLIGQNHLFKRSIILIKAWCYYESRILGAHHGLISTYALETLVLYIFHVFNNSFAGPLEVLYRFLEFFSNFDWEKFCVSLWGPVPISSLPDMAADPPRKDGGALLLSKSLLDICSSIYAVMPSPHDNQVQPFVSKYFNVIDPLRANNNLGRSVSKGNFFRIRSAFAFGAKRLARLLECPKEDLGIEVKQFFTNTWRRHGNGSRPDAPAQSLVHQTVKVMPVEMPSSHRNTTAHKKKFEGPTTHIDHDSLTENTHNYHDPATQLVKKANVLYWNSTRTAHSVIYPSQSQKIYATQTNAEVSGQLEKTSIPSGSLLGGRDQRISKSHSTTDGQNEQSRLQFARTNSSPELTDSSVHGFPSSRCTRVAEVEKSSMVECSSRRNNMIPGVSSNHGRKSSQEKQVFSMNASSNASILVSGPSSVSSSNHEDTCFATNEELASASEASGMVHGGIPREHDLMDGLNGQVPLQVQIPSHPSVVPSHLVASSGYPPRNLAGILPPNFSFIGTPWLHNMQFVHGFVPPPMTHYGGSPTFVANSEDGNESETSATTGTNYDDGGNWHEHGTGLSGNLNQESVNPEIFNFKDLACSIHDIPGARLHGQKKSGIDDRGETLRENFSDVFHQVNGGTSFGASNIRLVSSQGSSGHTVSDSSCEELTGMIVTSSRGKLGKTHLATTPSSPSQSTAKTSWQVENMTERITSGSDGNRNSNASPAVKSDYSGGTAGRSPSAQSTSSQVSDDHNPLKVNLRNPVFRPFFIGPHQQRQVDNSGLTFVPTGPPVPFVVYPYIPGNTDSSVSQFERSEGKDQFPADMSFQNFGSHDDADLPDASSTTPPGSVVADADHDHKSDILNGDFLSHWQNLQYGRFCQNARPPAPVLYPVAMPPMYLPDHFPLNGPATQPAHSFNWAQVRSPAQGVVPASSLQPTTERASGVFQRYGEDAPRFRGGTGTYLPTPKVAFKDRQSGSRNYRGSYNSERVDHNDKEGSWANSKQRNMGRYGRSQSEKSSVKHDRRTSDEIQSERHCQPYISDSYRREAGGPTSVQNHSFENTNSTHDPVNTTYGVPSQPSTVCSGTSASTQPVVMVYSYDQSIGYGVPSKPIEFGSFRAIPMASGEVQRQVHEVHANGFYKQRHAPYKGTSSRSSPDQPSMPHLRRS